ncbi:DUF4221 family protein [uncultured Marivirga sp.]|uniref:DUF4221 family protein n=1 Tax=uncultured Marivirga sp. TaxID=1123707 RepID=UPI0030ED55B7|tara:strand:+ start:22028 stop:23191 length:1164 start_codon:yes stop_codon:yes gene_type:complete
MNINLISRLIICFFLILFAISCSNEVKNKNNQKEIESSHELMKVGSKSFELDDETAPQSNQFQVFRTKDSLEILTFLNNYNNSIYFYDFESEGFLYKKTYEKEGAHGVGDIFGYHIHNLDSIFIYNYGMSKLFLFNAEENMINSYNLNQSKKYLPAARVATNSPIVVVDNTAYLTGNIAGEYNDETAENRPLLIKLNLVSKEVDYQISYPEIFREGNWGGGQYRWLSHNYNPIDSLLFFSFSVSHDFKFLDLKNGKVFNKYAGSKYIEEIPSISSSKMLNSISKEEIRDHFIINGSYQETGYVPSDNFYFRTVYLPESNYDPAAFNGLQSSMVLLDRYFDVIGETVFGKRSYGTFVISKTGLYLKKFSDNEDAIIFDQFKLMEIEKD